MTSQSLTRFAAIFFTVIILNIFCLSQPSLGIQQLERVLLQISSTERAALQDNQVSLIGEKGVYTGRILVQSSVDQAWDVLTDYHNYPEFLPNVVSAQVLEANGNQKVFEQIQKVSVFFVNRETRLKIAVTENQFTDINFNLVEGDVNTLDGSWDLIPITQAKESTPTQVLITYRVKVEPDETVPSSVFYPLYQDSLKNSLEAIKTEIEKRATEL